MSSSHYKSHFPVWIALSFSVLALGALYWFVVHPLVKERNELEQYTQESEEKSRALLERIQEKVEERGNKEREARALVSANELHEQAQKTIGEIEQLRHQLKSGESPQATGKHLDSTLSNFQEELEGVYGQVQGWESMTVEE